MIEILLSIILLFLLTLILNPFHFWMPDQMHVAMLVGLVVLFAVFAIYIFRERAHDEREVLHRFIAGRFAYLLGTGTLVLGIVYEGVHNRVNIWAIITLGIMILAKAIGLLYSKLRF